MKEEEGGTGFQPIGAKREEEKDHEKERGAKTGGRQESPRHCVALNFARIWGGEL